MLPELDIINMNGRLYDPIIGRMLSVDNYAGLDGTSQSYNRYSYVMNNPLLYTDPSGENWVIQGASKGAGFQIGKEFIQSFATSALQFGGNTMVNSLMSSSKPTDWYLNLKTGSISWIEGSSSRDGYKHLGEDLEIELNSYIDGELWDGPLFKLPIGDKLTSTISVDAHQNETGKLIYVDVKSDVVIHKTFGLVPGSPKYDVDVFGLNRSRNTSIGNKSLNLSGKPNEINGEFQQHAEVHWFEEIGLRSMGYQTVNIVQNLKISILNNSLSLGFGSGLFPSATLKVNGLDLLKYDQPSFKLNYKSAAHVDHAEIYKRFQN